MDARMFTTDTVPGRRLVLIDIENVAGGTITVCEQVHDAQAALTGALALDDGVDHIVVACGRDSATCTGFAWEGNRRFVFRPGIDGADLKLLEILETENIADRYSEVLLVSGDGIFTDAVATLERQKVAVTVVSRPEALSRRLRLAASNTINLYCEPSQLLEAA
jgi:hypothetical protein